MISQDAFQSSLNILANGFTYGKHSESEPYGIYTVDADSQHASKLGAKACACWRKWLQTKWAVTVATGCFRTAKESDPCKALFAEHLRIRCIHGGAKISVPVKV